MTRQIVFHVTVTQAGGLRNFYCSLHRWHDGKIRPNEFHSEVQLHCLPELYLTFIPDWFIVAAVFAALKTRSSSFLLNRGVTIRLSYSVIFQL
jgi:hypothetical protein